MIQELSEGQSRVLEAVWRGHNVFMTGSGGTGKSALVREIYRAFQKQRKRVQVVALTGCAAVLLGCKARTVHSFAGIGLGNGTIEENVDRVVKNYVKCRNWRQLDVLIVDEVSMMSRKLFEMLDAIARRTRRSDRPFGGLQVIFSGDFFQIRPIGNEKEPDTMAFCFESPLWDVLFGKNQIQLDKIFRQNDPVYARILNQIREGMIDDEADKVIRQQIDKPLPEFPPTKLFPTRRQVEEVNRRELSLLPKDTEQVYTMKEETDLPMTRAELEARARFGPNEIQNELLSLKKNLMCEPELRLRKGSHVMCIVNMELGEDVYLCNGSQGRIKDFTADGLPIVDFFADHLHDVIMERHVWESEMIPGIGISQMPLILSWAITIHKAQGATLESAEIDVGASVFECGQSYVALSRIKSLSGLYLTSFDPRSIYVNPAVRTFYDRLAQQQPV